MNPGSSPCKGDVITDLDHEPIVLPLVNSLNIPDGNQFGLNVYVDGSGGAKSGYGYVTETGESYYKVEPGLTNNQSEYMAILAALEKFTSLDKHLVIYSDSKVVVSQINHEYSINNPVLRELCRKVWPLISEHVVVRWIPRKENIAGKMLGS